MNLVELAVRLKRIRTERGLTLEEVATRSGLTRGWLSKVENFRLTPSLPSLQKAAAAMGVTLSDLFEGLDARPSLVVVPAVDRFRIRRDEGISDLVYFALAHPRPVRNMDPFIIEVPPTDRRPLLAHPGEEFMFVIRGQVDLEYGEDIRRLTPGDSAYFDGFVPHRIICRSTEPAQVLSVYHGQERGGQPVESEGSEGL